MFCAIIYIMLNRSLWFDKYLYRYQSLLKEVIELSWLVECLNWIVWVVWWWFWYLLVYFNCDILWASFGCEDTASDRHGSIPVVIHCALPSTFCGLPSAARIPRATATGRAPCLSIVHCLRHLVGFLRRRCTASDRHESRSVVILSELPFFCGDVKLCERVAVVGGNE